MPQSNPGNLGIDQPGSYQQIEEALTEYENEPWAKDFIGQVKPALQALETNHTQVCFVREGNHLVMRKSTAVSTGGSPGAARTP